MIVFGRDTICQRCRKRDRRKLPYADGKLETSIEMARMYGWTILKQWGSERTAPCQVRCPECDGKGYVTTPIVVERIAIE